jgi:hypothetical protein
MRWVRKRHGFWPRLLAGSAAAVSVGLLVAVGDPQIRAGVLTAMISALATAAAIGIQAQWRRHADVIRALPSALDVTSAGGRFPLVRDVSDAVVAGVHPAEDLWIDGAINRVPPYIERDFDAELHSAVSLNNFVLLIGESTAGKTRAAFETMRKLLGHCRLVIPANKEALAALPPNLAESGNYVIWLDDLERFLGPGGLNLSVLHQLLHPMGRILVLATMRIREYERYRDGSRDEMDGGERDMWREGRVVLRQARVIRVDRRWTSQEKFRAQAQTTDRRLAKALAMAERFGIAETMAAGPELREVWQHAWSPGLHPRGAALVAAAVGARRAGYHRPLPMRVLKDMHYAYLEERGGQTLHPESWEHATAWALGVAFPGGASSLLSGSTDDGYLAFDYLIDLPESASMPAQSWSALIKHADGTDAYLLAEHAYLDGREDRALHGYRRAAYLGNSNAEAMLGDLGVMASPPAESLQRAQRYLSQVQDKHGPHHPGSLEAELSVALLTAKCGRYADALTLARSIVSHGGASLGSEHRTVLGAEYFSGWCQFKLGSVDAALRQLEFAIERSIQALGRRDTTTAGRRIGLVEMLIDAGRLGKARAELGKLKAEYSDFPPWHTVTTLLQREADHLSRAEQAK